MESRPQELTEDRWHAVATLPDPFQARELAALLSDAGLPVRVEALDGASRLPGVGPDFEPRSFVVLVPEPEVPVAIGVAERLLPWFTAPAEGELSEAECIGALDEPHEVDFAAKIASERTRRARHERLAGGAMLVFVVATIAVFAAVVVRVLMS